MGEPDILFIGDVPDVTVQYGKHVHNNTIANQKNTKHKHSLNPANIPDRFCNILHAHSQIYINSNCNLFSHFYRDQHQTTNNSL
jgi:hypothetical protein